MEENNEKLSYDRLKEVAQQLSIQNNQLVQKLKEVNLQVNIFQRLNFLFKIVELKDVFKKPFYDKCVEEIQDIMTLEEEPKEEKE